MEHLGKDKVLAGIFESCKTANLSKVSFLSEQEQREKDHSEAQARLKVIAEQNKPFDVTEAVLDDVAHILEIDKWDGYSRDEFKKGMLVEQEHGKTVGYDPMIIGKIVLDHLKEDKEYYTKLAKVESGKKDEKKISEAEPEKLKIVAKGIADKAAADKIAAENKGMVAPDETDKDKFMVVVKEATQNKAWGFYGTLKSNYELSDADAEQVFSYMEDALVSRMGIEATKAGLFLDSKYGRHLADELSFSMDNAEGVKTADEVKAAIDKWIVLPKSKWVVSTAVKEAVTINVGDDGVTNVTVVPPAVSPEVTATPIVVQPEPPALEEIPFEENESYWLECQTKMNEDKEFKFDEKLNEVAPEGWEGTVKAMKKSKKITNPWALAHWMKGKGMKSHAKESKESVKEAKVNENIQIALSHAITSMDNAAKFASAALKAEGIDKKEQLDLAMKELKSAESDIGLVLDARKIVPPIAEPAPTEPVPENKEITELAEKLFLVKHFKSQKTISEKAKKFIADVEAMQLTEEKRKQVMEAFKKLCEVKAKTGK